MEIKKTLLILLIPSFGLCDPCDLPDVLSKLRPGATFTTQGSVIIWQDKNLTQPGDVEISTGTSACIAAQNGKGSQNQTDKATLKNGSASSQTKVDALIRVLGLDQ